VSKNRLFGEQLRKERKKQGLTVETIARICGISRSYITLIETGRRLPGKKVLPKIAGALNLKTIDVLNWYLEDISQKIQASVEVSN
jgi:transcriptional regulator with XRE-family HTH domain